MSTLVVRGVWCPRCKQGWSAPGLDYPSVSVETVRGVVSPDSHSPAEFRAEVQAIRLATGRPHLVIEGGTGFGPHVGTMEVAPRPGPIMLAPWTLGGTHDFWAEAKERFVLGPVVPAQITCDGARLPLATLEVAPDCRLDPAWPVLARCDECGVERRQFVRDPSAFPIEPLAPRIVASTFTGDVARIREWPTRIVVSARFAAFLEEKAAPGTIELEAVEGV